MWNSAAESKSTISSSSDSSTGAASASAKSTSPLQDHVFDLVAETFPAKGSSSELKER